MIDGGVWIVYYWDVQPIVQAIWADELEARRAARAYESVAYCRFGQDVYAVTAKGPTPVEASR